jgi:hypothetical protein
VVPFAVFHTDERGRMPLSEINRHLASEAGITSNDFGLRELQDEMIDKRIALWMSRRG